VAGSPLAGSRALCSCCFLKRSLSMP
jgi:hypothetical protein